MNQQELLWDYQQTDIQAEAIAKEIKRSPARQKLVKYRDYLLEQQNTIKRIEEEVLTMQDRLEVLEDAVRLVEDQLNNLQKKMESTEPQDLEQTERYLSDAQRMMSNLNEYEAEIRRIRKDSADRDRLQYDVKVRAARAKNEFDKLKTSYDEEYRQKNEELNALKNVLSEKAKGIAPEWLDKYGTIRRHAFPPLARLNGSMCTGCNMSLPSGVVKDVESGKEVECETCGRLLIHIA